MGAGATPSTGAASREAAERENPQGTPGAFRIAVSSFAAVDVFRPDQVVLALFLSPAALGLRGWSGLHAAAVLRGQERRLDHVPVGCLATRENRRPTNDVVAPLAHYRNCCCARRRAVRISTLAGS